MHCTSVISFVTQRCKLRGLLWQDIIYVLISCKKDTGLLNVLTHIVIGNVRNTTILLYIRIARNRCWKLLRLKEILQNLRKPVRLLQNRGKEATVVLKNSMHLKFYLPQPQSRPWLTRLHILPFMYLCKHLVLKIEINSQWHLLFKNKNINFHLCKRS